VVGFVEDATEAAVETRELGGLRVVAAVRPVAVDLALACPAVFDLAVAVDVDETPPELDGRGVGAEDSRLALLMLVDAEGAWRTEGALPKGFAAAAVFSAVVGVGVRRLVGGGPFLLERIPGKGLPPPVIGGVDEVMVDVLVGFVARGRVLADVEAVVVADRVKGLTCGRRLGDALLGSLVGAEVALFSFWFEVPALMVAGLRKDRVRLRPEVDDIVNKTRRPAWST
jgi:hypothetical protein